MDKFAKLTTEEAEKLKTDLEQAYPGKKFKFNPGVLKLEPIKFELESNLETVIKRMRDVMQHNEQHGKESLMDAVIVFPVNDHQGTKKNKIRLDTSDSTSPLGRVIRKDNALRDEYALAKYAPYAPAIFNAQEVMVWAAGKLAIQEEAKAAS